MKKWNKEEVIGFTAGVVVVGIVIHSLCPDMTVWEVVRLLVIVYLPILLGWGR